MFIKVFFRLYKQCTLEENKLGNVKMYQKKSNSAVIQRLKGKLLSLVDFFIFLFKTFKKSFV